MRNAIILLVILFMSISLYSQGVAGFQEYYVPGYEDDLNSAFSYVVSQTNNDMYVIVSVTASTDNTTLVWDHWENGYGQEDETFTMHEGDYLAFEETSLAVPRAASNVQYDGRDRLYVSGGPVSVVRGSYPADVGTVKAASWELFPVESWENSFTMPFGTDIASGNFVDFAKTAVLVMAAEDGTTVNIQGGNHNESNISFTQGECKLYTDVHKGTTIVGNKPIQVQILIGTTSSYEVRGISGVPREKWSNDYWAPIKVSGNTDMFLYNPAGEGSIIVNYENGTTSGTINIDAGETISFFGETGSYLINGGMHVYTDNPSDEFWGVVSVDTKSAIRDWAFDLIPTEYIATDYRVGWAPGSGALPPVTITNAIFAMALENDTDIFVDFNHDGEWDVAYNAGNTLDKFDVVLIADSGDHDASGAHIWTNDKKIALSYGEISGSNSFEGGTTPSGSPALDLGYTILPMPVSWIQPVIEITATDDQGDDPIVTAGEDVKFTLTLNSHDYALTEIDLDSNLDKGWEYTLGTTVITKYVGGVPTVISTSDPDISGLSDPGFNLLWDIGESLAAGDYLVLEYDAHPTSLSEAGENQIITETTGTYNSTQFTATDNEFITLDNSEEAFNEEESGLPVTLSSFTAVMSQGSQLLEWTTQSEESSLGWHVYRGSENIIASAVRITDSLIEGAGYSSMPTDYTFYDDDNLNVGETYWYFLENLEYNNSSNIVGTTSIEIEESEPVPVLVDRFIGNYPNPFNPTTTIVYSVKESSNVKLTIYNMKGQKVIELLNENKENGTYNQTWNGTDKFGRSVGSGLYLAKMSIGGKTMSRKMLLMK